MTMPPSAQTRVNRDRVFHHVRNTDVLKIPSYRNLAGVGDEPGMEGDIILDRSTLQFCFHNGITWVCLTTVILSDACGAGVSLVADGIGPFLSIKGLVEGEGIVLTDDGSCVTIDTAITLSDACGTGVSLVNDGTGPDLAIKGLVEGEGIVLTDDGSCVTIDTAITLSDACGTGVSLVNNGTGPALAIKGLVEGSGISLDSDASCVTINSAATWADVLANGETTAGVNPTIADSDALQGVDAAAGGGLTLRGGDGSAGGGGDMNISGGDGTTGTGNVNLFTQPATGTTDVGRIVIKQGDNSGSGNIPVLAIFGGNHSGTDDAGKVFIVGGSNTGTGDAGDVTILAGGADSGIPGDVVLVPGDNTGSPVTSVGRVVLGIDDIPGHITSRGPLPGVSTSGLLNILSTDTAGELTVASGKSALVTFSRPYTTGGRVIVMLTHQSPVVTPLYVSITNTTSFIVLNDNAGSETVFYYVLEVV